MAAVRREFPAVTITILSGAAHAFTGTWCGQLTSDVAIALNCAEAETPAERLCALGERAGRQ
ncbi:hypothetical protein ACFU99_06165 [Streptomyces sp. NPDC057654]|uniref:hypothetical protein n=1 Tax=Streptomyces sp. NPDC057654 TaxID=3346196 RepID=UPI00367D1C79